MPRQQRAESTREAVLLAAAEAFDRTGYAGTTMNDIVALAGKTKGAVYFHFPSKRDLALAVVHRQFDVWPEVANEVAQRSLGPLDAIVALTYEMARRLRDDVLVRAGARLALERNEIEGSVPAPATRWIAILNELFEQAIVAGELAPDIEAGSAARVLVSSFFGIQHLSGMLTGRQDLEERLDEYWAVLLPRLRAK